MKFNTIDELREQAIKDEACGEGLEWLDKQTSLKEVIKIIPLEYRLFCLGKEYEQFIKDCDWSKLKGCDWLYLLRRQPQFSIHCDWSKLSDSNWKYLLKFRPKFKKYRNRRK